MDPLSAYSNIRSEFGGQTFLLESVEGPSKTARYSIIGFDPLFEISSKGNSVTCNGSTIMVEDPYKYLKQRFQGFHAPSMDFLPFSGGMVGYMSYDIVRFFEKLPNKTTDDLGLPDTHLIIPSQVIIFDHLASKVFYISHGEKLDLREVLLRPFDGGKLTIGNTRENMGKEDYKLKVTQLKENIAAGDIFQAVLSRRLEVDYKGDELEMYRALRTVNPSPYLYFLDFDETKIIGSSPEMLVRLEGGVMTTRPLAGTRHRDEDPEEDEKLKLQLLMDPKERAEHVMLVDLHRNDMGRVSDYGSVKVTQLMDVEKYSHVQHIVSTVTSKLRKDTDAFDALEACFPAGTVSGAPKIRAMELLDELEPERRGPYAGVVGYFDFNGNMNFAINIRTIFTSDSKAYIQAGAGIVMDSDPEREYQETMNKMGAMVKAIGGGVDG